MGIGEGLDSDARKRVSFDERRVRDLKNATQPTTRQKPPITHGALLTSIDRVNQGIQFASDRMPARIRQYAGRIGEVATW